MSDLNTTQSPVPGPLPGESLQTWRAHLTDAVLLGATVLATPVVIAGSINQATHGNHGLIGLYLLLYTVLACCTFAKGFGFRIRSASIILTFFLVGASEFWTGGLIGDGKIFFFGSIILSSLLFGTKGGAITLAACMFTAGIAAYRFLALGVLANESDGSVSALGINWISALLNLLLLSGTAMISVGYLLRRLENSRNTAATMAAQLSREVTERQEAQAALARHQENLERRVEERTAELRETQAELQSHESLASLGRLTTTLSHELRTPLGTIHSSVFYLQRHLQDIDEPMKRAIDRITRSVKRCDHIIEELVMFGKDEALQQESVTLDDWIARSVVEISDRIALPVETFLNAPGRFRFDETQLYWCLRSILANASEALAEFGSCDSSPERIALHSAVVDGWIVLTVEDNGPGIDAEIRAQVLEPLFSTKGYGAGLGLAIARKIARIHGGDLDIRCPDGGGTIVEIRFPVEA